MSKLFSKNNPAQDIQMAAHVLAPKRDKSGFNPLDVAVIDPDGINRLLNAAAKRQRKAEKRAFAATKGQASES